MQGGFMNTPKTRYNEPDPSPIQPVQTPSGDSSPEGEDGKKPTYSEFLASKIVIADERGSESAGLTLRPHLFPHQADLVRWAIRGGNRAIFANFGLGKTDIQLQIVEAILAHEPGCALIVCPLGVKGEFVRAAFERFGGWKLPYIRTAEEFNKLRRVDQMADDSDTRPRAFITNYERVRDGDIDPNLFTVVSLDEASVLRSFGSKTYQTFLSLFSRVKYKYVCTATPDPNRTKELIHYAGFLGIMDTGQALTRFFKRDSTTAGNLQLHPHKIEEFYLWVSTWATFCSTPSDLGYSDAGYALPALKVIRHRLPVDHSTAGFDSWGQGKLLRNAATSLSDGAKERRDSLPARIAKTAEIVDAGGLHRHWIIWHDLEDERRALTETFPEAAVVYGTQDLEEREQMIQDFSDGEYEIIAAKPRIAGSGCNFQRFCYSAIFTGIGYKFNDFIQSIFRIQRFLQTHEVEIHLIYTESEDAIYDNLMAKWKRHNEQVEHMSGIIRRYGLNNAKQADQMRRSIGLTRQEAKGELYTAVNNDNVAEMRTFKDDSVDLIITSVPFSDHYEYVASYNDFGHNDGDKGFFEQMDYLTPNLKRVLKPGRVYCVHCKDRLLYGSVTGLGMYSVNPFSDKCVAHLQKHGLIYCGRITIVTDVVRENNQTYRLGWTENGKDGTKMGVGSPEYILMFRKLPTNITRAYADVPVTHPKPLCVTPEGEIVPYEQKLPTLRSIMRPEIPLHQNPYVEGADPEAYSRSRWQFDASPFWRSAGDRFLTPAEVESLSTDQLRRVWGKFNKEHLYNFKEHVKIAEILEDKGMLPASFMLLDPRSHSEWVWDDVVRMRTLNTNQARNRVEGHICPLQFDVVERLIERFSNKGELVLDPFAGLMTVPYIAVERGRRGYGIELSSEYWADGVGYLRAMEQKVTSPTLFDFDKMDAGLASS
jgi:DNA modification methylase